jgi:hypothetical protein
MGSFKSLLMLAFFLCNTICCIKADVDEEWQGNKRDGIGHDYIPSYVLGKGIGNYGI